MFRMGGDEFVLFLKKCRESIATRMLEQARLAVCERISGSFSYGIVYVSKHEQRAVKDVKRKDLTIMRVKKNCNTFLVVIHPANRDWQGNIKWLNKEKEENFRSSLELIKLIDSALASENKKAKK